MSIRFRCPCGKDLEVLDGLAGQRYRCRACGAWLFVPKVDAPGVTAGGASVNTAGSADPAPERGGGFTAPAHGAGRGAQGEQSTTGLVTGALREEVKCPQCGTRTSSRVRICAACGWNADEGRRFCGTCFKPVELRARNLKIPEASLLGATAAAAATSYGLDIGDALYSALWGLAALSGIEAVLCAVRAKTVAYQCAQCDHRWVPEKPAEGEREELNGLRVKCWAGMMVCILLGISLVAFGLFLPKE